MQTIGYLVPEFPGQTHNFIWRERCHLRRLGVETVLISTRRPQTVAPFEWARGAEAETCYLVPASAGDLVRAVFDVLVAGPRAWARCVGALVQAKGLSPGQRVRLLAMIPVAAKLSRFARRRGLSHVHVHSCADAANVAMLASFLAPLTYSLTLHGPQLETYGRNQPQKWRHARFALVVSKRLRRAVAKVLSGNLPPHVGTASMGVSLEQFRRGEPYTPWRGGAGPVRLFSCGRLNPVKGHGTLLEAVRLLRGRGYDVRLRIAGEDEAGGEGFHREVVRRLAETGLQSVVELLGAVSEEGVRAELERAHLFVLASLDEGVPVAVMEAMAMEVPAVVTDVGGTGELVENGVDALLVPPDDAAAFADAVARVLADPDLAERLSRASRRKVATGYHDGRSAEALFNGLRRLGRPALSGVEDEEVSESPEPA